MRNRRRVRRRKKKKRRRNKSRWGRVRVDCLLLARFTGYRRTDQ